MVEPDPAIAKRRIYKIVLTGGPCGGKTTGQVRNLIFGLRLFYVVCKVYGYNVTLKSCLIGSKNTQFDSIRSVGYLRPLCFFRSVFGRFSRKLDGRYILYQKQPIYCLAVA